MSVDDDPTNQEVIRVVFREQKNRFDVFFAMTGKEALERLNSETFDCVLLDLMMPDMSGAEVLESIRRTKAISTLPVIVRPSVTTLAITDTTLSPSLSGANGG